MNHEVQLLFLVVLGLAGQVVAVGGALLAFRLGAHTGVGRRKLLSDKLLAGQSTAATGRAVGHTTDCSPASATARDSTVLALLRCLRLPPVDDQDALVAWYGRLQLEGMALAGMLSSETQMTFCQALDAIRDILDTHNLDDRYELLAAALLPVYEGLHATSVGLPALAPSSLMDSSQMAAAPLNRFTMNGNGHRPDAALAAYRETPSPASEKSRLASLFEQVKATAQAQDVLVANPLGEARRGEGRAAGSEPLVPKNGKTSSEAPDPMRSHAPGKHLDTSRLSQRLAEILKTADCNDHVGDPADGRNGSPESTVAEHSAPELHLVSPPVKSRLKRSGTLTPEQEVARKAAHVVGRAREWYGRPDITLSEVQSACAAFGMEFNEVAARAELAKPLAEDVL